MSTRPLIRPALALLVTAALTGAAAPAFAEADPTPAPTATATPAPAPAPTARPTPAPTPTALTKAQATAALPTATQVGRHWRMADTEAYRATAMARGGTFSPAKCSFEKLGAMASADTLDKHTPAITAARVFERTLKSKRKSDTTFVQVSSFDDSLAGITFTKVKARIKQCHHFTYRDGSTRVQFALTPLALHVRGESLAFRLSATTKVKAKVKAEKLHATIDTVVVLRDHDAVTAAQVGIDAFDKHATVRAVKATLARLEHVRGESASVAR